VAGMTGAPGPTEVAAWQKQIIAPSATISGQTAGTDKVASTLYGMSQAERQQIALALKNAGYRVPTNGIFSDALLNAYTTALQAAQVQAGRIGQPFDGTYFNNYLINESQAKQGEGGAGGAGRRVDVRISDETTAKGLINSIFQDQLGRDANVQEIKKYTKALQKAQKASPLVTTYGGSGNYQTAQTTGGLSEGQFLIDKIAGTDEAKANKVLGFYETFMNALGQD